MTASRGAESPLAGAANLRGGILIAVAVVLGVVLLGKGFDSGIIGSSGGDPSDQVASGGDGGDEEADDPSDVGLTTTTTAPAHTPAEVRVQVLNSTGPAGSAGNATTRLSSVGFVALDATNADDRTATASAIFAQPGYEADAAAIATALGLTTTPQAMPAPPPPPAGADANVVVVLGPDYVAA